MSPVMYELVFYMKEDGILRSYCRKNLKTYRQQSKLALSRMLHK
jgi:hypothetical protein